MEEKSIEQLRREAQELYQSKLEAYHQAQKETIPKTFQKPKELKRITEPSFFRPAMEEKSTEALHKESLDSFRPKQQLQKKESQIFQATDTLTLESTEESEHFSSDTGEKSIDQLRREAQELYQSKLKAYKKSQKEPASPLFQKPKEVKKARIPEFLKIKLLAEASEIQNNFSVQKSSEHRNNWFVVSIFIVMVIIVMVKLLLFTP